MDLDEVKACLRALLSSTAYSYYLSNLLSDFRNTTGSDLPLFGCAHPIEFLQTLGDTLQLFGDPYNPEVALVKSNKSAHITSLVDRQRNTILKFKYTPITSRQKRLVIPRSNNESVTSSRNDRVFHFSATSKEDAKITKPSQSHHTKDPLCKPKEMMSLITSPFPYCDTYPPKQPKPKESLRLTKNETAAPKASNFDRSSKDSAPAEDCKTQIEKSSESSLKYKKTDNCYFDDVSDGEGLFSVEESKLFGRVTSSSCCFVNDGMKNKLKNLIKQYPDGLWCCELAELFLKKYKFELDYREFGYTSLIQMLSELPDVFRCVRPGNEDWILFDASTEPTPVEKKMMDLQSTSEFNCEVRANVQKLLLNQIENTSESGVQLDKIPDLYEKMFGKKLDFESFGFKDLKSLFETFEGTLVNLLMVDGKMIVALALKKTSRQEVQWEEAVPPITEENDIFREIFPKEVVGPDEDLIELDLTHHIAIGHVIKICVAEVWSPSKFYIQLNKYKERLSRFMEDLQKFYNVYLNKYKMPDATIRANQVCVGLYNSDPDYPDEWHRAQILKVINEKMVLINFVDYGTGFLAKLSGIVPPNDEKIWPVVTSKKFLEYLRVPNLDAEIVDVDFKKPYMSVVLYDSYQKPETNINYKLVKEKLAKLMDPLPDNLVILQERENLTRGVSVDSSSLSVPKNLAEKSEAFSDIDDSSQPTLFHYKMKALKIEDSLRAEKKSEDEKALDVVYEFDEVPELESNCEKKSTKEENEPKMFEDEIKSKLAPPSQKKLPKVEKQSNPQPKPNCSPAVEKPMRCPPGLEHVNVAPELNRMQFLVPQEDVKKRINVLTLELLSTNPSIKQVGVIDPTLALKIATEMAEAYVRYEYASKVPLRFNPVFLNPFMNGFVQSPLNAFGARGPVVPVAPVISVIPPVAPVNSAIPAIPPVAPVNSAIPSVAPVNPVIPLVAPANPVILPVVKPPEAANPINKSVNNTGSSKENSPEVTQSKEIGNSTYVKKVAIGGKTVHLVVIDNQFYCEAEEIVRTFTLISNRDVADRVLQIKKIPMTYKVVTKKTDEDAYNAIKSSEIEFAKKRTKKLKFYLISLSMVAPFLRALGCFIKSFENEVLNLQKTESANHQRKPSIWRSKKSVSKNL